MDIQKHRTDSTTSHPNAGGNIFDQNIMSYLASSKTEKTCEVSLTKLKLKCARTSTRSGRPLQVKVTSNCDAIYADGIQVLLLFTQGFIAIYVCREAFFKLSGTSCIQLIIQHLCQKVTQTIQYSLCQKKRKIRPVQST